MMQLTEEQLKHRRARSIAIAWALVAMAAIFFAVTIVRLGANVAKGPF